MELQGKKVMVLGLARTGSETARFLVRKGAEVLVSDCRSEAELKRETEALSGLPVRFLLGGEEAAWLEGVELLVASPGVPAGNPLLRGARQRGIGVISEIELACRFLTAPLVAITGTNGKSTTSTLVGEMLEASGLKVFVGGNIGAPLIGFVGDQWNWGVVEVSSFQLEWVEQFRPGIAVLLNLTEDHLDRYPDFASYCEAKERIFHAQTGADVAVLNRDDPLVWPIRKRIRSRPVSFGWAEVPEGVYATSSEIIWRGKNREESFSLARVKIQGVHNVENLMAAIAAAKSAHVSAEVIQRVMEEFPGLEHRLEFVREKDGIRFYNDSKGTNVGAVVKSLASFSAPVVLIAGGIDKGGDYRILEDEVKRKVKKLVLFGMAKEKIRTALGHLSDTAVVESLEAAVQEAYRTARPGEVVLLSPACSSFDMFQNYAERGKVFKTLVQGL
ncbi:MAG: UDP-N-acetylmuramoyl-L-alanine--D-glutamate ligase [Deltaproteobacteria bacterium]|nr:UDP-N-acetylmuramoyl-L-alanine--D-glutamate ligase [Deltaproteobacteria bacterium]